MSKHRTGGRAAGLVAILLGTGLAAMLVPSIADAGTWMQISCVNPNGTSAPSDGWSSFTSGAPGYGSDTSTNCAPGTPMYAILSSAVAAPVNAGENLQYTPPSGSMLVGGSVDVDLYADGAGYNASGTAVLYTPAFSYDGSDVVFQCASGLRACSNGAGQYDFSGVIALPANRGGDFYIGAGCGGAAGYSCNQAGSNGAWALVHLGWAKFLLSSGASPGATGFAGSLLSPDARGTANVSFTASDAGGPGVYNVTVQIDGGTVYTATPNTNSGHCIPVGTDTASGALMFDWQQPCPTSQFVDVPVNTAGLATGPHLLTATVTDAARNTSTVLTQTITTASLGTVTTLRSRPHHVKAKLVIVSEYSGTRTRLISIKAHDLPRHAHIAVLCRGRVCPRPTARTARASHAKKLWRALARQVFSAGERVIFTITAPHLLPERSELLIRDGAKPVAKRL